MDRGSARQARPKQQAVAVIMSGSNQHVFTALFGGAQQRRCNAHSVQILLPPTEFDRMHALANIKLDANHYD